MGGVISLFFDIIEISTELSAATGFAVDAVLAGEAAAAVEVEVMGLMTVEGLSASEALGTLGLTMENFSLMHALPGMLSEAVGIGTLFQTISGASGLVAAGIRYGYAREVSIVNRNISQMALQVWRPWDYYDILFPGVQTFAHYLNVLDHWASSLIHTVSRYVWDAILHEGRHQIGHASRELMIRGTNHFQDLMARLIENSRWVLTTGPSNILSLIHISEPTRPY